MAGNDILPLFSDSDESKCSSVTPHETRVVLRFTGGFFCSSLHHELRSVIILHLRGILSSNSLMLTWTRLCPLMYSFVLNVVNDPD
jgi:hypothetical protein